MCLMIYGQQHATLNLSLSYISLSVLHLANETLSLAFVESRGVKREVRGAST